MSADITELWVEHPGLYTVVQDSGRPGYQAFGVPVGGALDRRAARMANWLVGASENKPVLEITLQGPRIQFTAPLQIALSGGDLSPVINGYPAPMYETINLAKGDVLAFGKRKNGCRTYLAMSGHWLLPEWLGSRSALQIGKMMCPPGSILSKDQHLSIVRSHPVAARSIPVRERPFYSRQLTARILPGPEFSWLEHEAFTYLITHPFTLSADCSRMGYRLQEALPGYEATHELISSGIVSGTIQLLPSGKPIILLADAQTTGGYPRIANVRYKDLDDLGQLAPGDKIRFEMA